MLEDIFAIVMQNTGPVAIGAGVTIFVIWLVGRLVRAVPVVRKVTAVANDFLGEPERPGVDARPGLMERQKTSEEVLAQLLSVQEDHTEILKELAPNHGSTIKDKVDKTHEAVVLLADSLGKVTERVAALEGTTHTTVTSTVNVTTETTNPTPPDPAEP